MKKERTVKKDKRNHKGTLLPGSEVYIPETEEMCCSDETCCVLQKYYKKIIGRMS